MGWPVIAGAVFTVSVAGFEGVGLSFNPETRPEDAAAAAWDGFDLVNCMSVHPGYSGQPFLAGSLRRLASVRSLLPPRVHLQVDGGIDHDNVRAAYEAGARLFVAGSSVFGREDLPRAYRRLVQLLA